MATVSVVMATFNGARFLPAQLESLRAQTKPPLELVVGDDGSQDGTLDIVRTFAASAPFPVVVQENPRRLGYGENFLTAARLCQGEMVAFCDQDDEWDPRKLELCCEALEREDAVLCVHAATLIDARSQVIGRFDQGIDADRTVPPLTLAPWDVYFGLTQVFRRSLLDLLPHEKRGLDNHAAGSPLSHDRWVQFLAGSFGRTALLAEPLVRYRQHGKNAYGGLRKSTILRARGKLVVSAEIMELHETIAAQRARLLGEANATLADPGLRQRAAEAQAFWQDLAMIYAQRARLYREPALRRRLEIFRELRHQAPAHEDTLGRKVLWKDFLLGVCRVPVQALTPRDRPTATTASTKPHSS